MGLSTTPGIQPEATWGLGRGACYVSTLKQMTYKGGSQRVLTLTEWKRAMRQGAR